MTKSITRRFAIKLGASAAAVAGTSIGMPAILRASDTVKVGLSIPITGLQAILGETLLNCYRLAGDELNSRNGIGGRQVEFVVEDNQTTTRGAIDKARKLVNQDRVDVVMGNIISVERSATLSVTSRAKKLFFYPTFFEGGECDPYFVTTAAIPSQQVDPVMPWIAENLGTSIYIFGSDYSWPHKTTEALQAAYEAAGGTIVGADYYPFGTHDFGPAFQRIRDLNPDVVWSMVVGNDGVSALTQYRSFDIRQPLITPSDEVFNKDALPPGLAAGTYASQPYWMAIDTPANEAFIANYRAQFGQDKMLNSIGEAGYNSLHLYALAVEKADSVEDDRVIAALPGLEFEAPQGLIRLDGSNNHCVLNSYLGQAAEDGVRYDVVEHFGVIEPHTPECSL